MTMHCDREWEIDALREGRLADKDAASFERHIQTCAVCMFCRKRDSELRAFATALPVPERNAVDHRRMRARILRDVELRPSRPAGVPFKMAVALLILMCATTAFAWHERARTSPALPSVVAAEKISWSRSSPLAVSTVSRALPISEPTPATASVTLPAPPVAAGAPRISSDRACSNSYSANVALFQAGDFDAAAKGFAEFLATYPHAAQAEDASFLEASSLARAGRPDAAGLVAEHHLASFPHSFHREDAAILVARAARDRGECAKAREVLAPWTASEADPSIVATLRSCSR